MTATTQQGHRRRQVIGSSRVWEIISISETAADRGPHEVSRSHIMQRTGLPARDLRVLDPVLSYPSSILGRERAIVINLEHIKAILTATHLLIFNSSNPFFLDFLHDLHHRLRLSHHQAKVSEAYGRVDEDKMMGATLTKGGAGKEALGWGHNYKSPPFEFKALEACLESACRCLESETSTLEQEAYPALDELSSQISTLNLERVRQIKSRLVAISGRVQKVRDELEHLLDDDNDMAEMYLTEKLTQSLDQRSSSLKEEDTEHHNKDDSHLINQEVEDGGEDAASSKSGKNFDASTYLWTKPNLEELEMLLEAYFAQVDGISQKLSTMSEYVGDTEDYINIMLDDKRNQLLEMGVMLSAITMIINTGLVVVGLLGMNIHIPLFDRQPSQFWETAIGIIAACILLCIFVVGWGKQRFLMSI